MAKKSGEKRIWQVWYYISIWFHRYLQNMIFFVWSLMASHILTVYNTLLPCLYSNENYEMFECQTQFWSHSFWFTCNPFWDLWVLFFCILQCSVLICSNICIHLSVYFLWWNSIFKIFCSIFKSISTR